MQDNVGSKEQVFFTLNGQPINPVPVKPNKPVADQQPEQDKAVPQSE